MNSILLKNCVIDKIGYGVEKLLESNENGNIICRKPVGYSKISIERKVYGFACLHWKNTSWERGVGEIAQYVKALAAKADDLSPVPRIHLCSMAC